MRQPQIQHPIAQRERRIDKCRPGDIADNPISRQTTMAAWNVEYGFTRLAEEHSIDTGRTEIISQPEQPLLYVFDRGASRLREG